jgi:hypothetical protein
MNQPMSPATTRLIPRSPVLAHGLFYIGDGEATTAMIPDSSLPPIPLDPQAADGAIDRLIPR